MEFLIKYKDEERDLVLLAMHAAEMYAAIHDLREQVRQFVKHSDTSPETWEEIQGLVDGYLMDVILKLENW